MVITSWHLHHLVPTPLPTWGGVGGEASYHLDGLFLTQLGKHFELSCGITFKIEAYGGGQNNGCNDAKRLNEVVFNERQHQRHSGSGQEYTYHGVAVLLQVQPPHGLPPRGCQHVLAVHLSALCHFSSRQALSLLLIHAYLYYCVQSYTKIPCLPRISCL